MSDIDSETLESSDFNESTTEEQVEQNTEPELGPWPYINKYSADAGAVNFFKSWRSTLRR